jgi:hypothetical protein
MKITVNGNLCEIKPVCSGIHDSNTTGMYTLTIRCYANKSFTGYEKEKICDAVEELLKQEGTYADGN